MKNRSASILLADGRMTSDKLKDWRQMEHRHNYPPRMGDYEAAMTFDEIAAALQTDKQHVWCWYASAIKKLRRNPSALLRLLSIADLLAAEREKRFVGEILR